MVYFCAREFLERKSIIVSCTRRNYDIIYTVKWFGYLPFGNTDGMVSIWKYSTLDTLNIRLVDVIRLMERMSYVNQSNFPFRNWICKYRTYHFKSVAILINVILHTKTKLNSIFDGRITRCERVNEEVVLSMLNFIRSLINFNS